MPEIKISESHSIEGHDLKEIPVNDWLAEGERLFGMDVLSHSISIEVIDAVEGKPCGKN